jgi:hypothetical protein
MAQAATTAWSQAWPVSAFWLLGAGSSSWVDGSSPGAMFHLDRARAGQLITVAQAGRQYRFQVVGKATFDRRSARVTELGGQAGEPMPVPAMGWFSACRDPQGNEFGLWQTDASAPAPGQ